MSALEMKRDTLSIKLEGLEILIDFSGEAAEYIPQLREYLATYDVEQFGTLLNLKNWARNRGISYTIKIHKIFDPETWLLRILIVLNDYLEGIGRGVVRPEKS